jgi:meiosis-specific protein HOP1
MALPLINLWKDGIFDALKSGVLDRMQLSIILDKHKPSNVLESYTFKFTYKERRLDGMVVSSEHGKLISLRDARSSLATLNRYIKSLTEDLPDLPRKLLRDSTDCCSHFKATRFLTVHVFYTDDCPQEYIAPGFRPSRDYSIVVPHNDLWRMVASEAVDGNFGYYRFVNPRRIMVKKATPLTMTSVSV